MTFQTFKEYVFHREEGTWLPNKPIVASMGKINPFPISQGRRDRLVTKPVKPPQLAPSQGGKDDPASVVLNQTCSAK